ncbi:NADH-quinone oxidoreductase subunit E [Drosophila subobscura]|uniref:NADH-quinone oxidoreductase subunit E n=1 Tax=Drosophila subobscura TaxID=7241 RepID=UPI00155A7387|nr:NADH-quinone oxidoreductase subunit E [Drosophila subobscura]
MFGLLAGRGFLTLPRAGLLGPRRTKLDAGNMYDKMKFEFTKENQARIASMLTWYPAEERRGALLPLLDIAQRQHGWLPITAVVAVAELLKIDPMKAYETAKYYTMFYMKPRGKFVVSVCTSTPCYLRGGDELLKACSKMLRLQPGETSKDMQFTLKGDYCLGACVNAPVASVNDDLYEDLTEVSFESILSDLKCGRVPPAGPCSGRCSSEPIDGQTTLLMEPPPAGYGMRDLDDPGKKCK